MAADGGHHPRRRALAPRRRRSAPGRCGGAADGARAGHAGAASRHRPAWQQTILRKIIAGLTEEALRQTREAPGIVVKFEIEAMRGGSVIVGELRDPHQPRSQMEAHLHYLVLPGALSFADKATLLSAMETAVTYNAEVRLRSGEVACCRTKPAIAVTGRFEGLFTVNHADH